MSVDLAVVFPRADVTGGVERVALDFLGFESAQRTTCFVGETVTDDSIDHVKVTVPRVPSPLRPAAFRRAAERALQRVDARTIVSMGVNCPPGDVYWVHSVHAAWLHSGGDAYFRGHRVSPAARRLLPQHQVLLRLEREYFTGHRPRAILCTSAQEIDDLSTFYDVPRDLMRAVPNGYDARLFSPGRRDELRTGARGRIGAAEDDIVVLMVANEWHRKGLGVLLEAVAGLRDPRVRIDLVGAQEPAAYTGLAQRLGLAHRVHWHGRSSDVAFFLAAADVFALPTTYEPFGLVIIEAMASGLPVVTSRLAGAAAAIVGGVSGLLLDDPRDADALADSLRQLCEPAERALIGAAGARAAEPYERLKVFELADSIVFPPPT